MKREALTLSRCREDMIKHQQVDRRVILILAVAILPLTLLMCLLCALEYAADGTMEWPLFATVIAVLVMAGGAILLLLGNEQYKIRQIRHGELVIAEDLLTLAHETVERRGSRRGNAIHVRVFLLQFQQCGPYRIPRKPHYEWSRIYSMTDEGVYHTSEPGDRFWVVYLKNARKPMPLAVYNQKLFELCEEGTPTRSGDSWRDSVEIEE